MDSIEKQDYPNIQVCIADGSSTDGTLEIIKEYALWSKHEVKFRSEKDSGIYDGINKSIAMADGDYLEIMNDEYTRKDAIRMLVDAIEMRDKEVVGAHCNLVYQENGVVRRNWRMGEGRIYFGWLPGHPSLMLKREIYEKYGLYDCTYICSADYEFMLRFLKDKKNKLAYVDETLISMFYGGTSNSTLRSYWVSTTEGIKALAKNKIPFPLCVTFMRIVRVALQFVRK